MTELLWTGHADAACVLLLAHGAGAPMTSPFLERFSAAMSQRGAAVGRFEFAYMAGRRTGGRRRPPPKAELLRGEFAEAVEAAKACLKPGQRLFIGGKSMGGRVASLIAESLHKAGLVAGLVCLGYPFHPPGRPGQLRTAHLDGLTVPALFVQGERDPFGSRAEVDQLALSSAITVHWIADGDHDLKPRGGSAGTALAMAADAVAAFMRSRASPA
jgi:predicted alpha/beta-hydrolase family hydrolase